jgi:hypothetical protein
MIADGMTGAMSAEDIAATTAIATMIEALFPSRPSA